MIHAIWQWFLQTSGTHINPSTGSQWYNFWSGFGSDLGEITLIGLAANWYRMHRCDMCFRLSKHDVHGTHYSTCHHHFTESDHAILQAKHKLKFPKQHSFHKTLEKEK